MPKLKTHSGAKKRLKISKNGKVIRGHAYTSHLLNGHGKTAKSKRHARGTTVTDKTSVKGRQKDAPPTRKRHRERQGPESPAKRPSLMAVRSGSAADAACRPEFNMERNVHING